MSPYLLQVISRECQAGQLRIWGGPFTAVDEVQSVQACVDLPYFCSSVSARPRSANNTKTLWLYLGGNPISRWCLGRNLFGWCSLFQWCAVIMSYVICLLDHKMAWLFLKCKLEKYWFFCWVILPQQSWEHCLGTSGKCFYLFPLKNLFRAYNSVT